MEAAGQRRRKLVERLVTCHSSLFTVHCLILFALLVLSMLEVLSEVEGLKILSLIEGSNGCATCPEFIEGMPYA